VEVQAHSFLTLALERGEWSTSCPGYVTSGKEPNELGGGAGWAAGPGGNFWGGENSLAPSRNRSPDSLARSPVEIPYAMADGYSGLPGHNTVRSGIRTPKLRTAVMTGLSAFLRNTDDQ